ncbi:integrase repeat-containing protein [Burkholderia cenocepacia]|uniref:integrase repeat-containing protein n=1 Tax=Burkholderia cenocepacia TaxID=95486 RepID=UPI001904CFAE|nr:integrase repeat-containing protein [Burkholderia cenocepacia]MBJ9920663.1 hypothetical protein [Burkholderia cenocepacia]
MARKTMRSLNDASAWAQAQGIMTKDEWDARAKMDDWPTDIPKCPQSVVAYKGQWKGFKSFLGVSAWSGGLSRPELALKHGLQSVLDLVPGQRAVVDPADGERVLFLDLLDRSRRLAIEYDGRHWHKGEAPYVRDAEKSLRLTAAGWSVIRVREAPLALLNPTWDVAVQPPRGNYWSVIEAVLRHMARLIAEGHLQDDGLSERIDEALNVPLPPDAFRHVEPVPKWSYVDAKAWVQPMGIKTEDEWRMLTRSGQLPPEMPGNPPSAYPDLWEGWGTFLGTGNVYNGDREFCTLVEASMWAQAQRVRSQRAWQALGDRRPSNIPSNPQTIYKSEWQGWGRFLGTGTVANDERRFCVMAEASTWGRDRGISTKKEWSARNDRPAHIPSNPQNIYKIEWRGWAHFLGTDHPRASDVDTVGVDGLVTA